MSTFEWLHQRHILAYTAMLFVERKMFPLTAIPFHLKITTSIAPVPI